MSIKFCLKPNTRRLGRVQRNIGSSMKRLLSSSRTSNFLWPIMVSGRAINELSLQNMTWHKYICWNYSNLRSNHFRFGSRVKISPGRLLILFPSRSSISTLSPNFFRIFKLDSSHWEIFKYLNQGKRIVIEAIYLLEVYLLEARKCCRAPGLHFSSKLRSVLNWPGSLCQQFWVNFIQFMILTRSLFSHHKHSFHNYNIWPTMTFWQQGRQIYLY